MNAPMNTDRLQRLLDAYGARLQRWPKAEAEAAEALLATCPEARNLLRRAEDQDRLLAAEPEPAPPQALREAVIAAGIASLPRPGWRALVRALLAEIGGWRVAGPAVAAALMLGLALGLTMAPTPQEADLLSLLSLDDGDLEF